jgi:hypothetical protein
MGRISARREITEEIKNQRNEVEIYQCEVLDPIKERLGDIENPATADELESSQQLTSKRHSLSLLIFVSLESHLDRHIN